MKRYLVDIPTLPLLSITACSEEEAIAALNVATLDVKLRVEIGRSETPIELINFTRRGDHTLLAVDDVSEQPWSAEGLSLRPVVSHARL